MSLDFNVEELKRSMLNLSEAKTQLETYIFPNPVKTIIRSRQTLKRRPSKFIRVCAWLDGDTDWSEVNKEKDRQSEEKKSVPRRRARRIKLNWNEGEGGENDAQRSHGPIITTFASKDRRLLMK